MIKTENEIRESNIEWWMDIYRKSISHMESKEEADRIWENVEALYQEKLNAAKRDYEERRRALNEIWEENGWQSPKIQGKKTAPLVREVVAEIDQEFTVSDVETKIREKYPYLLSSLHPSSISGVLSRMHKEGSVDVVSRGVGPVPSVYKRSS